MSRSERSSSQPATADGGRLLSLDSFRGLTILAMILVNNPGQWGPQYWPLAHAAWHGWTPTDLIFPFFLFIVGTSLAYSLRKYRGTGMAKNQTLSPPANEANRPLATAVYWRIARRTVVLLLLGLLLNSSGRLFDFISGDSSSLNFDTLRFPGVLQRIALVYFITSLVVLHVGVRAQAALAAILLLGYWALLAWLPAPENYESNLSPEGNVVRLVDRAVFGDAHMYTQARSEKTDPEGLLSTFPAVVTCLLGYWTGLVTQLRGCNRRTVTTLVACGLVCAALGLLWNEVFPINKKIWTSSFVLLTGGLAMVLLAGCLLKFDVWGWRRLARPFEIVGINAIFVFVAASLTSTLLSKIAIGDVSAREWLYQALLTSWITDPKLASFGFAVATVAFWWLVCWAMSRLGWSIRV